MTKIVKVPGATPTYDTEDNRKLDIYTCNTCNRSWNNADVSSMTPVPSGRCPFEYDHATDS